MTTIGLILIWLAVLVLGAAIIDQRKAFTKLEEIEMRSISSLTTIKQDMDKRMDGFVSIHNASVDHYDKEIEEIVKKMEKITEDIARIDHDEKDLRKYYVNYRKPNDNFGVNWAGNYVEKDDEEEVRS